MSSDAIYSQKRAIIDYLKGNPKGITTYEAFVYLGCTKLSTRISELKKAGFVFDVKVEYDAAGKHWNRYWLINGPKQAQKSMFTKLLEKIIK